MIKSLTSLRLFFALMVFLSHLDFFPKSDTGYWNIYDAIFYEGYLGVSFFFILSGFVLSLSYKSRFSAGHMTIKEYLVARIARIYPLHLLTLLAAIPFMLGALKESTLLFGLKFLANGLLMQSWIPDPAYYFSFNSPSWSISAELFFYVMFPFLLLLLKGDRWRMAVGLILIMPIAVCFSPDSMHHKYFYVNPAFRIFDFVIGMLLYQLFEKGYFKPSTIAAGTYQEILSIFVFVLFVAFHQYVPQGFRYGSYYWLPMAFVILTFSYSTGEVARILSNRYLVIGGEISFGFYMLHQLVIKYIVVVDTKFGLINNPYILSAVMLIITLIASYFVHSLFEMPMNRVVKRLLRKPSMPAPTIPLQNAMTSSNIIK